MDKLKRVEFYETGIMVQGQFYFGNERLLHTIIFFVLTSNLQDKLRPLKFAAWTVPLVSTSLLQVKRGRQMLDLLGFCFQVLTN